MLYMAFLRLNDDIQNLRLNLDVTGQDGKLSWPSSQVAKSSMLKAYFHDTVAAKKML